MEVKVAVSQGQDFFAVRPLHLCTCRTRLCALADFGLNCMFPAAFGQLTHLEALALGLNTLQACRLLYTAMVETASCTYEPAPVRPSPSVCSKSLSCATGQHFSCSGIVDCGAWAHVPGPVVKQLVGAAGQCPLHLGRCRAGGRLPRPKHAQRIPARMPALKQCASSFIC